MEVKINREIRDYTESMFLEYSEIDIKKVASSTPETIEISSVGRHRYLSVLNFRHMSVYS